MRPLSRFINVARRFLTATQFIDCRALRHVLVSALIPSSVATHCSNKLTPGSGQSSIAQQRLPAAAEQGTISQLAQCSLNAVTPLRNNPEHGMRDDYRVEQCRTWVGTALLSTPLHHLLARALLPKMAQRFGATSSRMARAATATPGTGPFTGRYTPYGALHPIRTGALLTDRVQRSHQQAQPRT